MNFPRDKFTKNDSSILSNSSDHDISSDEPFPYLNQNMLLSENSSLKYCFEANFSLQSRPDSKLFFDRNFE